MKIMVTQSALKWFKDECGIQSEDYVRFFARYGGSSTIHEAYSIGFIRENPNEMAVSNVYEGITFYLERDDIWYLDGKNLLVDYQNEIDEISYSLT